MSDFYWLADRLIYTLTETWSYAALIFVYLNFECFLKICRLLKIRLPMQSSCSCQIRHCLSSHCKGVLLGKNAAHPTVYIYSHEGRSGAEIKMQSQNTLSTPNKALQPAFVHYLHVPTAVSISAPPSEFHCLLQWAVSFAITDLFINGHSWSLDGHWIFLDDLLMNFPLAYCEDCSK